jgi:LCP family protein required for cell wall assembly
LPDAPGQAAQAPPDEAPKAPSFWKRILAGALLIVLASAAGSAALAFNELDKLVAAFNSGPKLDLGEELALAESGQPQTIMLLGSDERAESIKNANPGVYGEPRSDTVILVRLDPEKGAIAMMSLPRDLKVQIPGHGTDRLNAAYELGGPRLTLETVKEFTGLRINHVVNVDFGGFIQIVNRLDCVYTDVDRSYFSSGIEFSYINLHAGYQRLCGEDALSFVRYRHTDNDLIRAARQQEFLRQAKQQFTIGELVSDRDRLLQIFGEHTQSDIDTREETLSLLKLVIASADEPVREVHFQGTLGESYVTASDEQVKKLTEDFLGVQDTEGPRGGESDRGDDGGGDGSDEDSGGDDGPELQDSTLDGESQAQQVLDQGVDFPVFYPTQTIPGTSFIEAPSVYEVPVEGQHQDARAYRIVMSTGVLGEYYGIQGLEWKDPPILKAPTETRTIDGTEYELHFDGDRLRLVAWERGDAAYWVSNTLLQSLSEEEMLAVASSARELSPGK